MSDDAPLPWVPPTREAYTRELRMTFYCGIVVGIFIAMLCGWWPPDTICPLGLCHR